MHGLSVVNPSPRSFGVFYDELAESQGCDLYGTLGGIEVWDVLTHDYYQDP